MPPRRQVRISNLSWHIAIVIVVPCDHVPFGGLQHRCRVHVFKRSAKSRIFNVFDTVEVEIISEAHYEPYTKSLGNLDKNQLNSALTENQKQRSLVLLWRDP